MATRLALIGFGNVGQGFARILVEKGDWLRDRFGLDLRIVAVSDFIKGSVYDPEGLDPETLLEAGLVPDGLAEVPAPHHGWDALTTIRDAEADTLVELTYTDLETGEPAITHVRAALEAGRNVVTTNKGPVALAYPELAAIAADNGVEIGCEGTVMSGTPTVRLGTEYVAAAGVTRIEGILNGTTNYILTLMEGGSTYEDALALAQEKGYAEADPTGDVGGHDAAGKVVILANLVMGASLTLPDVDCTGITGVRAQDVAAATEAGERWKLIGSVALADGGIVARVRPVRVGSDHPLYGIGGATNAVTFTTDLLGQVTLVGPGAGRLETGYALLVDLIAMHRQ
jgi:homoserine dehydrogenase